jgi:hypothetical protein
VAWRIRNVYTCSGGGRDAAESLKVCLTRRGKWTKRGTGEERQAGPGSVAVLLVRGEALRNCQLRKKQRLDNTRVMPYSKPAALLRDIMIIFSWSWRWSLGTGYPARHGDSWTRLACKNGIHHHSVNNAHASALHNPA